MAAFRYTSIKRHLHAYHMAKRISTIRYDFAAAIAPAEPYDEASVRDAMVLLGQDPDDDLRCVYCDEAAASWDHLFGLVDDKRPTGHGHLIRNLVPCCVKCNGSKGKKNWRIWLEQRSNVQDLRGKIERLEAYSNSSIAQTGEHADYDALLEKIVTFLEEADKAATKIRDGLPNARRGA